MNNIICGKCTRKQNKSLEERKQLAKLLQQGLNRCECGRVLDYGNGLRVIEEGS